MKTLIVYDSLYGNTEKIAKAVAGTLTTFGEVKVLRVGEVNLSEFESVDLLVVGSPTQGGKTTLAIQEFLSKIPANSLKNISVTSFDTRVKIFVAKLFGYAAGRIAEVLTGRGGYLIAPPEPFYVKATKGPLEEGELERAAAWGKGIAAGKK